MNELTAPDIDFNKPHILVADRAKPHIRYQQGAGLYDRKGHYVEQAAIPIYLPEPKKPEVKERDITQRVIGRTNKTIVEKISAEVAKAVGAKPSNRAEDMATKRLGAAMKTPIPDTVVKAQRENMRAAAAEQAV